MKTTSNALIVLPFIQPVCGCEHKKSRVKQNWGKPAKQKHAVIFDADANNELELFN